MKTYKYFKPEEFLRATPPCTISQVQESFLERLEVARIIAGIRFRVNSAYRSEAWEREHNRSGLSMHCLGRAVDISCKNSESRYIIVSALLRAGFRGIGISKTFIHVDDRTSGKPLIFLYND